MSKKELQDALELLAVATFITPKLQAKRTEVINAGLQALAEQPAQQEPVGCQYAKDVAMPEYRCVGRCQYDTSTPAQQEPEYIQLRHKEEDGFSPWGQPLDPKYRHDKWAAGVEMRLLYTTPQPAQRT